MPRAYLDEIAAVARRSEAAGAAGMLIYTDNSLADPWTVAQAVLERTERFVPLVATQPLYMHPLTAARKVSSLAFLYGRRLALNMVAGGFARDLTQLGDGTAHDDRYARLIEYTRVLQSLLRGEAATFHGEYYRVEGLRLAPALDTVLMPDFYVSGASEAAAAAAAAVGATQLGYTGPPEALETRGDAESRHPLALRLGIIARPESAAAWEVAHARFPADRRGQLAHRMAMNVSDSVWLKQLGAIADKAEDGRFGVYWLEPLRNYKTFCPYLVGSYDDVADCIARYRALGYRTLVLDAVNDEADLSHILHVLELGRRPLVPEPA
nr:LLM class flavin-dependent oxidoreductase [Azospirillum sp. TSH100]